MRLRFTTPLICCGLVVAFLYTPTAQAIDEPSIELFIRNDNFDNRFNDDSEVAYGLRGGFWFGERWGFEGSVSTPDSVFDVHLLDLSARYSLLHQDRHRLFLLGGAGIFRVDFAHIDEGITSDDLTLHVALAYTYDLSERFYVRPQFLNRWVDTNFDSDQYQTEASLAIGLRF